MPPAATSAVCINAGSSSIKFAFYNAGPPARVTLRGAAERIGLEGTTLSWTRNGTNGGRQAIEATDAAGAIRVLIDWLEDQGALPSSGAGHRVVHGMAHTQPVVVTPALLAELREAEPYAPDHLPREIQLIEALSARYPELPQVACFDTAFHATMPRVATLLPIPRRYDEKGVRRYGFHGLSYAYLVEELARAAGADAAAGRVVLAHLGNGASLAAVKEGRSVDTTMGFTPASGLVMSTRTGDLDPGLVSFLARTEQMTATEFHRMVNHESGLLGLSGVSSDMRDLLARERSDARAAEAVEVFCYQARKWIAACTAAIEGLDTLVFSAGIGERSPEIRARICEGLGFLGIELDAARNDANAAVISTDASRATVRVIPTDEEVMIARSVFRALGVD
jgi:acetate kinase